MSAFIYWLAIRCYALAVRFASVFNGKAKLFIEGRKGLLSRIHYALVNERRPRIWMHCASLGEFEQGRPLLEKIRKDHPEFAVVLTFFSPSGYEVRKDYKGADYIFYLPLDSRGNARKFIHLVQPKLSVFVKYDFWFFMLKELERRDIPAILISSIFRKEQPFFKWYGGLHRQMLYCFSKIFVQDKASTQLLQTIKINDAVVAGDTRFDRVVAAVNNIQSLPIAETFIGDGKVLIAGSTWPEDEAFLQKAYEDFAPGWKLIVVPHEVDEMHISRVMGLFGNKAIKWSEWKEDNNAAVLIVDKIGLLLSLYQYATVAWIGGGFGKGIHNTLEAAAYGIPVGFGTNYHKFREAKELIAANAAFSINEPQQLVNCITNWEKDNAAYELSCTAARQYVMTNAGATAKIMSYLSEKNLFTVS
jgi:3-deoxy-D-manno-octulosonic-acid transferase